MKDDQLPECFVQDEEEEGFIDLDLKLISLDILRSGGTFLIGKARHEGRVCGFALELNPLWKATSIENTDSLFFWGSGFIRSIGKESDVLLAILSGLYGIPVESVKMRPETRVTIVGLNNDPRAVLERPTRLKLFFEGDDPDAYAEVFVNVNAEEGRLEFHEKDPEYRKPLLNALSDNLTGSG